MSKFPDFTTIDFAEVASTPAPEGEAWNTPEGVTVAPAYDADDVAGLDFTSGYPGVAPFVRGPYPTMYVTNPWTVRQYAGFSTAEDSNASTVASWPRVRWACRWHSNWPPTAAMTATMSG